MIILDKTILVACIVCLFSATGTAFAEGCDRWFAARGGKKGVVLLIHGANLRPDRMDEMGATLAERGYETYRPGFRGHCDEGEGAVTGALASIWEKEAQEFYATAKSRAGTKPLFLVAYSFGALIYQVLGDDLRFARRVYFAPAFATKFWYRPLVWLAGLFPGFSYPSLVPKEYRANNRTSLQGVLAFDVFLQRWKKGEGKNLEEPILLWMDPKDELVSYDGVVTHAADKSNWRLERLSVKDSTLDRSYHHLITDSRALGANEWERVMGETTKFLEERK